MTKNNYYQTGAIKRVAFYVSSIYFLIFFAHSPTYGQGPTTIQISQVDATPATCPSNGSIVIQANGCADMLYQIVDGPEGYPTGQQNANTFSDLLAGDYIVKVSCQTDPGISATTNVTIADQYEDLIASSMVSGVCASSSPGGSITTTASSGSPPYQYAYFQGDPGTADNDPVILYGSSNTYVASAYGVYNVRVKDACGVFVTHQISVEKTYPDDLRINQAYPKYFELNCTQVQSSVYIRFYLANGAYLSSLPPAGFDVDVYYNTGTCDNPVYGALATSVHFGPDDLSDMLVPNKSNLIFVLVTPCGDQTTYCYEYDAGLDNIDMSATIEASDCEPAPDGGINHGIWADVSELTVIPINYELKNSTGTVIATHSTSSTDRSNTSAYFSNLNAGTYIVTATDACGKTISKTVTSPSGMPGVLTGTPSTYIGCATINGRTTVTVNIQGVMANLAAAKARIVSPSPSGVGTEGENGGGGNYTWTDVIPGGTYTIEVDNLCGQTSTLTVTLPAGEARDQHINASVRQLCGGTGDITIDLHLGGHGYVSFDLMDGSGNIVGSGTAPGGVFTNLSAGTYSAVAHVTGCGPYDFSRENIQILPGGTAPLITKKLGIICEQADGTPSATGKAILAFIGAQPLKVDYRLTSQTDADYINVTNDSDGSEIIDGLLPGTSYTVRVTDACGNSVPVQISLGQLDALTTETTEKPCSGSPYTLSVPDMVDATYSWTKDGVFISSERSIHFPNYNTSEDGLYECTIVIGGCVTRKVQMSLSDCKMPVTLINFTATTAEDINRLEWTTTQESGSSHFEIQRSLDAKAWKAIGSTPSSGDSKQIVNYQFDDVTPFAILNYYRLKMVDLDGSFSYSRIVKVGTAPKIDDLIVYPNPVSQRLFFSEILVGNVQKVQLVSSEGKTVRSLGIPISSDGIDVTNLPTGIYTLILLVRDGSTIQHKLLISK